MCFLQLSVSLSWAGLARCSPDVGGDGKHLPLGSQLSSSCSWGSLRSVPGRGGRGLEQHPSETVAHTQAETHPRVFREFLNPQQESKNFLKLRASLDHPF